MAKEAVEKVQKAENEAAEIVLKAENDAAELLLKAGVDADNRLKAIKDEEAQKLKEAQAAAQADLDAEFDTFKTEVKEECEKRREQIISNGEGIIGRIIEAVKRG